MTSFTRVIQSCWLKYAFTVRLNKKTKIRHVAKCFWNSPSSSSVLQQVIFFQKIIIFHISVLFAISHYWVLQTSWSCDQVGTKALQRVSGSLLAFTFAFRLLNMLHSNFPWLSTTNSVFALTTKICNFLTLFSSSILIWQTCRRKLGKGHKEVALWLNGSKRSDSSNLFWQSKNYFNKNMFQDG